MSIIPKGIVPASTRIVLNYLNDDESAENFYNYLNTNFCRNLLSAGGGSRDRINHILARFIPDLVDYSSNNPIFMSDEELKKKYKSSDFAYNKGIFADTKVKAYEFISLNLESRIYKLFDIKEVEKEILEKLN